MTAEEVCTIPISDGSETIVDCDDHAWLSRWKWKRHKQGYACRTTYDKATRKFPILLMHRFIVESVPHGLVVDHINRNKMDNRRSNLRIVTQGENNHNRPAGSHAPRLYPDRKMCELCGREFTPNPRKRKRQKTCNKECATAMRNRNMSRTKRERFAAMRASSA